MAEEPGAYKMSKRILFHRLLTLEPQWVRQRIQTFLEEDIPKGDLTTLGTIPAAKRIKAIVNTREKTIFAGREVIPNCFPATCQIELLKRDGDMVNPGEALATITGSASEILSHERVMLNLIQRLCGIANLTQQYVSVDAPKDFMILDTRKMTPGLRLFEKYAVAVAGGFNHRLNLSTGILIKDNHIQAAGGVKEAVMAIQQKSYGIPIELEVDTLEQLKEGLKANVDGFLLDNMSPETVKEAVQIVRNDPEGELIFIEASGGINLKTLPTYTFTGVDGVSIGALTTQAVNVDIGLEFEDL